MSNEFIYANVAAKTTDIERTFVVVVMREGRWDESTTDPWCFVLQCGLSLFEEK